MTGRWKMPNIGVMLLVGSTILAILAAILVSLGTSHVADLSALPWVYFWIVLLWGSAASISFVLMALFEPKSDSVKRGFSATLLIVALVSAVYGLVSLIGAYYAVAEKGYVAWGLVRFAIGASAVVGALLALLRSQLAVIPYVVLALLLVLDPTIARGLVFTSPRHNLGPIVMAAASALAVWRMGLRPDFLASFSNLKAALVADRRRLYPYAAGIGAVLAVFALQVYLKSSFEGREGRGDVLLRDEQFAITRMLARAHIQPDVEYILRRERENGEYDAYNYAVVSMDRRQFAEALLAAGYDVDKSGCQTLNKRPRSVPDWYVVGTCYKFASTRTDDGGFYFGAAGGKTMVESFHKARR